MTRISTRNSWFSSAAGAPYTVGGMAYRAKFAEPEYEDEMFWGTGEMRWIPGGNTTLYTVLYPDDKASILAEHALASTHGAIVPLTVPFVVGGNLQYQNYKLYADQRVARMGLEFLEQSYGVTPEFVRLDMPVKRLTRTRRR